MWRWIDPEHTTATNDEGQFEPAGSATLAAFLEESPQNVIEAYRRFRSLEEAQAGLLADLADRRWRAEQRFVFNGMAITLDDSTQRRIAGAIQYLELSEAGSVRWQVTRGVFVTLDQAALRALGVAAGAHVQACFANVEALAAAIENAATIEAAEAVDLDAGWPS